MKLHPIFLLLCLLPEISAEEKRVIQFWPDSVPAAIHSRVNGVAALDAVRSLGRFHRVHGSPGFAASAEWVRGRLLAAGIKDVQIERFPADGKTEYAHFRSYFGWNPVEATLEEVSPRPRVLAVFPDLPVALADYSQDAEVTAALVDVGAGTDAKDYQGKDVSGKLVLASGALPAVHRRACEERGARGFLSDFPNQRTAWSGDDRDLVRWGHLSPYQLKNTFAFMLSKRQSDEFRTRLSIGEKITLKARVRAKMVPSTLDVVEATIPGTDRASEEIVLSAHLCHQSAGANDNASGSAAILEIARALQSAISAGDLPKPHRTIRFLWLPEIAGSQAYLTRHPEVVRRLVAGIHMDMVGGLLATTRGTFHLSRSAETLPHVVNEIAAVWFDHLVSASAHFAERGGDPYQGLVWPSGSREMFLGDVRALEMGSDHEVFEEASFGIPMVYFHDWPDVTIHTNKDLPENLDATKLGRVAYLGAGIAWTLAALPDAEASKILDLSIDAAEERFAKAMSRVRSGLTDRDAALRARESVRASLDSIRSVAKLWPTIADAVRNEERRWTAREPRVPADDKPDSQIPIRDPKVRGPLGIYYYDHIMERLGPDANTATKLSARDNGEVLAYEALNLVDGKRSVSEIRDILTGRYEPIPIEEVRKYLDLLAKASVVTWK